MNVLEEIARRLEVDAPWILYRQDLAEILRAVAACSNAGDSTHRDAERYRKLRDDLSWTLDSRIGGARLSIHMPGVSLSAIDPNADEFDAAIDAAMNGANT